MRPMSAAAVRGHASNSHWKETRMKIGNVMAVVLPLALTAFTPTLVRAADDAPAAAADEQQGAQRHERHHRDPAQHVQKRLDKLKADLQIKADQEAQWSIFSNAVMQQVSQF